MIFNIKKVTADSLGIKKHTTKSFTLSNQSVSSNSYKSLNFSIALDGYNALGIIGIEHLTYELALVRYNCDNNTAIVTLRNISSSNKTANVTITVLYEEA